MAVLPVDAFPGTTLSDLGGHHKCERLQQGIEIRGLDNGVNRSRGAGLLAPSCTDQAATVSEGAPLGFNLRTLTRSSSRGTHSRGSPQPDKPHHECPNMAAGDITPKLKLTVAAQPLPLDTVRTG